MSFVHLHLHSDYSTLDGACRIDLAADKAAALGMPALALTDHGVMSGVMEFQSALKKKGIKPLIGCEIYLTLGSNRDRAGQDYYHMGLLCRDIDGYRNLMKLVSDSHLNGFYYKPRTDLEQIAKHAKGLIGFTGCLAGVVPQMILRGELDRARQMTATFIDIFGRENFFVELQNHGLHEQSLIQPQLLRLAQEFSLRTVATNDCHYIEETDADAHDALLCIGTGKVISDENRLKYARSFHMRSADEMARLFPDNPEALTNTLLVADMVNLEIKTGGNHYPVFPIAPELNSDAAGLMHSLGVKGLWERYGISYDEEKARPSSARNKEIVERYDYELSVIKKTGFVDYFLIVQDFIAWARSQKIPVGPGRGSGAGCLIAYVLRITDLDPLRFNLLFERFLNPERVSPPDFDIDFSDRRRGEVINYVREKYGRTRVANIATYGALQPRSLFRDLARVNGHPYSTGDQLSRAVPPELGITVRQALEKSSELRSLAESSADMKRLIRQAERLEGLVRSMGKHAAGIVITDGEISDYVPLTVQEGDVTTQYDMGWIDKLGLLKMDFLGLRTLTVIDDAEAHIRRTRGGAFSVSDIPLDDQKTFDLLNRGEAIGVFQMESGGIQSLAKQLQVSSIDEIIALVALYRPGPMDLIPDYIRGKKDPSTVRYPHPLLENVCRETYGIMVYQEQVMEAAKILAGYTLGGADMLRRAMGKKIKEEMDKQRSIFIEGCARTHGIDAATAENVFALLEKFAGYGFNKSHSAAYGLLTYQTAYLKANYPVEFMAAVLTSELGNANKLSMFVEEATRMGIRVLCPDINESRDTFTPVPDQNCIRFGLAGVKNVGAGGAAAILDVRDAGGSFKSLDDLLTRVDTRVVNKRVLEALVKTGAFATLHRSRGGLLARLSSALTSATKAAKDLNAEQGSFLDMLGDTSTPAAAIETAEANVPEFSTHELLGFERELLGYYLSGHPMDRFRSIDSAVDTHTCEELTAAANFTEFRICGVVLGAVQKTSKRDNLPWAEFTLATKTGNICVHLYSSQFPAYNRHLDEGNPVIIIGNIRRGEDNSVRYVAGEIYDLEKSLPLLITSVDIAIGGDDEKRAFIGKMLQWTSSDESGITKVSANPRSLDGASAEPPVAVTNWKFSLHAFREMISHAAALGHSVSARPFRPRHRRAAA